VLLVFAQNYITLALFLVGTAATIYLIYAGYKYISSAGDEAAAAEAKRQIIYAVIGIVVAAGASVVSQAFVASFPGGSEFQGGVAGGVTIANFIRPVINAGLAIAAIAAVAYLTYAGASYFASGGDEDRIATARRHLAYAVIGIIVVILSAALVNFVLQAVT
jgi:cell division protein FtsW (lipid II flippase)